MQHQNKDFLKAIAKQPENYNLRLVYSDWLEEHGEIAKAEGWRWAARTRKRPFYPKGYPGSPTYRGWFRQKKWLGFCWHWDELPDIVFDSLPGSTKERSGFHLASGNLLTYFKRLETAFVVAWDKGWRPGRKQRKRATKHTLDIIITGNSHA